MKISKNSSGNSNSPDWSKLSDEELLELRMNKIALPWENSPIAPYCQQLLSELSQKEIRFKPEFYVGDEWCNPEGSNAISIPFYLTHQRLEELEKNMMLEVEGGNPKDCMMLLRHECGHAFDAAFKLSKKRDWRKTFGDPNKSYQPDSYQPHPFSKKFVQYLDNWYAQSHPEEDFAETFAVWLDPEIDHNNKYKKNPHIQLKLNFVEKYAQKYSKDLTHIKNSYLLGKVSRLKKSLKRHYQEKKKLLAEEYPAFYDEDLCHIFSRERPKQLVAIKAEKFLRKSKKHIVNSVAYWTGQKKFNVERLVRRLILRCQTLDLWVDKSTETTNFEVAAFLSNLLTNYQFTGKFRRTV